jgi:hypothetical protein
VGRDRWNLDNIDRHRGVELERGPAENAKGNIAKSPAHLQRVVWQSQIRIGRPQNPNWTTMDFDRVAPIRTGN